MWKSEVDSSRWTSDVHWNLKYNQTGRGFTIYFLTLSSSLNIAGNLEMSIVVRMDKVLGSCRSPITHEANKKIGPLLTVTGVGKFSNFILCFFPFCHFSHDLAPMQFHGSHQEWMSLVAQTVKNLPAVQETQVQSLIWEDPPEKEMATHSSTLAWKMGSTGSQRVRHD